MATILRAADSVTFIVLIIVNISLGLYFALYRGRRMNTTKELFLGSRSMNIFPLALSTMASEVSGTGMIGFTAHYYLYGIHINWTTIPVLLALPLFCDIILSVLYKLQITSLFEVRFQNTN